MSDFQLDPKFLAGVDMLRRTGAMTFRFGWTDEEDEGKPVIYHATIVYPGKPIRGDAAASLDPVLAVMRLCEQLIDGGTCVHCKKGSIFEHETLNFDEVVRQFGIDGCVTAWDPELKTFRRGCE